MAVYTVHEPLPRDDARSAPEPERFVFVRDGFSFWALLFGPLWMLRHRMWLVLLGYIALMVGLSAVLRFSASDKLGFVVWGLIALLIGLEAGSLRRFALRRRGYRNIGIVVGDDLELAERRFFDVWVPKDAAAAPGPVGAAPLAASLRMSQPPSDVLGLFPEPGAAP
jgi:Protein of unknown function (DUF2628)